MVVVVHRGRSEVVVVAVNPRIVSVNHRSGQGLVGRGVGRVQQQVVVGMVDWAVATHVRRIGLADGGQDVWL